MKCNYRLITVDGEFQFRSIYYDSGFMRFMGEPASPYGDSVKELLSDVAKLIEALKHPILIFENDVIKELEVDNDELLMYERLRINNNTPETILDVFTKDKGYMEHG